MSVEKMISTLTTLEKMHKSLLELALKKTDFIKAGDMDAISELLKNEQAHVAAIDKLELQRQQLAIDFFGSSTDGTVSAIIEKLTDGPEKDQLTAIRERFIDLLSRLKEQNDLNQKLTFQSLQFVNMTLEMMRPQQAQAQTMNYSGDEVRGTAQVNKKSYFDSQA